MVTHEISAHELEACPVPRTARLVLSALGDFPESLGSAQSISLDQTTELSFPTQAVAFEAQASLGNQRFFAYADRERAGHFDLLLWPERTACKLAPSARYPALGGGQGLGYSAATGTLLVSGGSAPDDPSASVAALGFDSGTGDFSTLGASAETSLAEPRAFSTVTSFGSRLLVAGGENPLHSGEQGAEARDTAEVFDPASGRFEGVLIGLTEPRTRHAALALPGGETLLVGGRGAFGDALEVLETIPPGASRGSIAGLSALIAPRLSPTALLLDDGRVFVGGGTAVDGTPLSAFEWLSSDGREHLAELFPSEIGPRHDRAFAALPGGGVLIAGGCEAREPADADDAQACAEACRQGCPPTNGYDAWWIAPDGALSPVELPAAAPRPVLLGDDGAPWLFGGSPGDSTVWRFNPWKSRFEAAGLEVLAPPRAGLPATSLGAQAFAWLAEEGDEVAMHGMRLGTRNRYSRDLFLVTRVDPDDPSRPLNLVPDRAPMDQVTYDGTLVFSPSSPVAVLVAGTDYLDLTLRVEVGESSAAPRVVLGSATLGGADCPWPELGSGQLRAVRHGRSVTLVTQGGQRTCTVPEGRLRAGLMGGDAETRVLRMEVEREL